jgi:hypothetical protein
VLKFYCSNYKFWTNHCSKTINVRKCEIFQSCIRSWRRLSDLDLTPPCKVFRNTPVTDLGYWHYSQLIQYCVYRLVFIDPLLILYGDIQCCTCQLLQHFPAYTRNVRHTLWTLPCRFRCAVRSLNSSFTAAPCATEGSHCGSTQFFVPVTVLRQVTPACSPPRTLLLSEWQSGKYRSTTWRYFHAYISVLQPTRGILVQTEKTVQLSAPTIHHKQRGI